jgi:rubrerythrin
MPKKREQQTELLCQMLETELGGIQVYRAAIECAVNEDLKEEWGDYLAQTEHHLEVLLELFEKLGIPAETETTGRAVVRHLSASYVAAMKLALESGEPETAQLVAAECVVLAETKDHLNWELLGEVANDSTARQSKELAGARDEVEPDEDEHLYHTAGWARELWMAALGLPAVLPPPEDRGELRTAGAARARPSRDEMV